MASDDLYREHIREAIAKIEHYTKGLSLEEFGKSSLLQDGVVREFEIIGEAAKHLSLEFRRVRNEISWRQVMSMRDRLIHEYFDVDVELVWKTLRNDLPALKRAVGK